MLRVRTVRDEDRPLLMAAAEADEFHKAVGLTGDHWLGEDSLFYEDERGPVVALKSTKVIRADIQFLTQDHERNARALLQGFWKYAEIWHKRGVKEIIFNTNSPEVAKFFSKRFHFRELKPGTYSLRIA
jgi:hypothetical protein